MTEPLLSRCTGKREPLPKRFAGPAALLLLGIALVTAPGEFDAKWGRSIIDGGLFTALVYRGV